MGTRHFHPSRKGWRWIWAVLFLAFAVLSIVFHEVWADTLVAILRSFSGPISDFVWWMVYHPWSLYGEILLLAIIIFFAPEIKQKIMGPTDTQRRLIEECRELQAELADHALDNLHLPDVWIEAQRIILKSKTYSKLKSRIEPGLSLWFDKMEAAPNPVSEKAMFLQMWFERWVDGLARKWGVYED